MKNLIKYTLGLPLLLFITPFTLILLIITITLNVDSEYDGLMFFLKELWKPYGVK